LMESGKYQIKVCKESGSKEKASDKRAEQVSQGKQP